MTHPENPSSVNQGLDEIAVVIGSGAIAQAIVRRIGTDKTILLADINDDAAKTAATALADVGFRTQSAHVDVSSGESVAALAAEADALGTVINVVHTAGTVTRASDTRGDRRRRPRRYRIRPGGVWPHHRPWRLRRRHLQSGRTHAAGAAAGAERGA